MATTLPTGPFVVNTTSQQYTNLEWWLPVVGWDGSGSPSIRVGSGSITMNSVPRLNDATYGAMLDFENTTNGIQINTIPDYHSADDFMVMCRYTHRGQPGSNWGRILTLNANNTSDVVAITVRYDYGGSNNNAPVMRWRCENGGHVVTLDPNTSDYINNSTYLVAIVKDGNTLRIYRDGTQIASTGITVNGHVTSNNATHFSIGYHQAGAARNVTGHVNDIRIYQGFNQTTLTAFFSNPWDLFDDSAATAVPAPLVNAQPLKSLIGGALA